MLTLRTFTNATQRVRYFMRDAGLDEGEKRGVWFGQGAAKIGLAPGSPVAEKAFHCVLEGFHPESKRYLGLRYHENRRAGWDIVLTPNKSISVAALCASDPAMRSLIRNAWNEAITDTFPVIERLACSHYQGISNLPSGGLVAAGFVHQRSRHGDPLLHSHLVVANATPCLAHPDTWRSLEPAPIFRHSRLLDVAFQRELLRLLRAGGLDARLDERQRVDLPGILTHDSLRRLSKAKEAIDAAEEACEPAPLVLSAQDSATPLRNRQSYRSRLNDRIRPAKKAVQLYPVFDTLLNAAEQTLLDLGLGGLLLRTEREKSPLARPTPLETTESRLNAKESGVPGPSKKVLPIENTPAARPDRILTDLEKQELAAALANRIGKDKWLFTSPKLRFREFLDLTQNYGSKPLKECLPIVNAWGYDMVRNYSVSGKKSPDKPSVAVLLGRIKRKKSILTIGKKPVTKRPEVNDVIGKRKHISLITAISRSVDQGVRRSTGFVIAKAKAVLRRRVDREQFNGEAGQVAPEARQVKPVPMPVDVLPKMVNGERGTVRRL